MKRLQLLLIFIALSLTACNNTDAEKQRLEKENELLKEELEMRNYEIEELQNRQPDLKPIKKNTEAEEVLSEEVAKAKNAIAKVEKLMNNGFTKLTVEPNGDITYDSGTAANGRFEGNLNDLKLSLKVKDDEIANKKDGSPSNGIKAVINVSCKSNNKCLEDLGFYQKGSVISFGSTEKAAEVLELLKEIQNNL